MQRLVNLYGESMIASYTVATRMENILMIPILGVQNTMATFAGQNMGAQRPTASPGALARACWYRFP